MKPLLEGALELPFDKYRIKIDELENQIAHTNEEKNKLVSQIAHTNEEKEALELENQQLRNALAELQKQAH